MSDPLEQLIRTADAGSSLPARGDLAGRVRERIAQQEARRRIARRGLVALSLIVAAAVVIDTLSRRSSDTPSLNPQEVARLRSEADRLASQAAALEREVRLAQTIQKRQALRAESSRLASLAYDPNENQTVLDRAASIPLVEGDFLLEVQGDREAAQASYQRTIKYFPDSTWGAMARERLEQLNMN